MDLVRANSSPFRETTISNFLIVCAQSKGTLIDGKLMREISYIPLEIDQKLEIEGATTNLPLN